MGMYDYLKINTNKLPLTEKERAKYGNRFNFQTKDWDCKLAVLEVTDEGELVYHNFDYGWDNSQINALGTNGVLTEENKRVEKIPYHGFLNFYDYIDETDKWFEFNAKFTDGKLVEIIRVTEPQD